jgi:hypothetical protein
MGDGGAWSPDGAYLVMAAVGSYDSPIDAHLYVLTPQGAVAQQFATPDGQSYALPAWVPHTAALSYEDGSQLLLSTARTSPHGLELATPA